jgi:hypothetical protein
LSGVPTVINTFVDSGGTLDDFSYLLRIDDMAAPVNAEYNDWGLCSLADIEKEVRHQPDDPALGLVDYDPFIEPDDCPTPTPSASPSETPSATPTATAASSPTPSGTPTATVTPTGTLGPGQQVAWGDANCSGAADPVDALLTLRDDAGLSTNTGDCPDFGTSISLLASALVWGDIDCSGGVDPVDALKLLRFDAALGVNQPQGCPALGVEVTIVPSS